MSLGRMIYVLNCTFACLRGPVENLMANIRNCSRSKLCMKGLLFFSFLAVMVPSTPPPPAESVGREAKMGGGRGAFRKGNQIRV